MGWIPLGGGDFPDHEHPDSLGGSFSLTDAPDGGWSWYGDPRAVYHNGVTYFGFVSGTTGNVSVAAFDHDTRTVTQTTLAAAFDANDHANPTILVRDSDSRIMVFYSKHNGDDMWLRISTNPESIASFGAAVNLDSQLGGTKYTYPNPVQLLGETDDPIYLIYRSTQGGAGHTWSYSKSTDGGTTWAAGTDLLSQASRAAYLKVATNGLDRIDFGVSDGSPNIDADVSIYHFCWHDGAFRTTDGTPITPVLDDSDLTLVYDGAAGQSTLVWDAALDPITGHPRIVWVGFPSTSDHRYWYGRWDGSRWSSHEIIAGGDNIAAARPYYSGGLSLDHDRPAVVYASIETGSSIFDIYRLSTTDGGNTWSQKRLTDDSVKSIRPVAVRSSEPELRSVWMKATTYIDYTDYNAGTGGSGLLAAFEDHTHNDLYYTEAEVDALLAALVTGGAGELLMQDGVTAPPVPIETEARDDWLYEG